VILVAAEDGSVWTLHPPFSGDRARSPSSEPAETDKPEEPRAGDEDDDKSSEEDGDEDSDSDEDGVEEDGESGKAPSRDEEDGGSKAMKQRAAKGKPEKAAEVCDHNSLALKKCSPTPWLLTCVTPFTLQKPPTDPSAGLLRLLRNAPPASGAVPGLRGYVTRDVMAGKRPNAEWQEFSVTRYQR